MDCLESPCVYIVIIDNFERGIATDNVYYYVGLAAVLFIFYVSLYLLLLIANICLGCR